MQVGSFLYVGMVLWVESLLRAGRGLHFGSVPLDENLLVRKERTQPWHGDVMTGLGTLGAGVDGRGR